MKRLLIVALGACSVIALGPAAGVPGAAPTRYPSALVVLGNSVAGGYGSDPAHPYLDAPANSWATGRQPPRSNSVYSRILAANPALRGHAVEPRSGTHATIERPRRPRPARPSRSHPPRARARPGRRPTSPPATETTRAGSPTSGRSWAPPSTPSRKACPRRGSSSSAPGARSPPT